MYLEYMIYYLKSRQWLGRLSEEFCACIQNSFCYPYFCLQEQHHQLAHGSLGINQFLKRNNVEILYTPKILV